MNVEKIIAEKMYGYGLYSQEEVVLGDKQVPVKLFNAFGAGTWYITEYDPDTNIAFGYIEWLAPDPICDEWGYISIPELCSLRALWCPAIEVDIHFEPKRFWDIGVRGAI